MKTHRSQGKVSVNALSDKVGERDFTHTLANVVSSSSTVFATGSAPELGVIETLVDELHSEAELDDELYNI